MAKNFRICTREKNSRKIHIQRFGDFDASSACQVIRVLGDSVTQTQKVAIDTDGLRTINAFGVDILLPHICGPAKRRTDIEVVGRFSSLFQLS